MFFFVLFFGGGGERRLHHRDGFYTHQKQVTTKCDDLEQVLCRVLVFSKTIFSVFITCASLAFSCTRVTEIGSFVFAEAMVIVGLLR